MRFYKKDQLKDSRIFFDKKPPLFGTIFIFATGFIIVGSLLISSFLIKPYIVKAQGIVNTSDNQYVSVNVNGTILEMYVQEGETVSAGQNLIKISNGQEGLQAEAIVAQLDQMRENLSAMDLYQKSLEDKKNYMKNQGVEQEYYGYMEYYLSQVNSEDYSNSTQIKSLNEKSLKKDELTEEIKVLQNEIEALVIPDFDEGHIQVVQSELLFKQEQLENLKAELQTLTDPVEISMKNNEINSTELEIADLEISLKDLNEKLDNKQIQESKKQELQSQIDAKNSERESIITEIESLQEQLNNPSSQSGQMFSQLIMELGKSRTAIQAKITELEANLALYGSQVETYTITAQNDGIVHYVAPIRIGMALQQNQTIAEISTQKSDNFIIEAYVNATDIAKVAIGDPVNVAIVGVNVTKYGTLKGGLVSIDSGTISQETSNGNTLLYRVLVSVDEYQLNSKNDTIKLIKSMPVEARIVYESETYFEWILKLLNFQ